MAAKIKKGDKVVVRLGTTAAPDVSRLKVDPPAGVKSVETRPSRGAGGTDLILTLEQGADGRAHLQLLARADTLLLTEVQADVEGDAHFPPIDSMEFIEERREPHEADPDNEHDFDFVELM